MPGRWMSLVAMGAIVACGSPPPPGPHPFTVRALAGDLPEPGAAVLLHHADGTVAVRATTNAAGEATLPAAASDDLISVVFVPHAGDRDPLLVTTSPPEADEIEIVGPAHADATPPIAGTITIDAPAATGSYRIALGCVTRGVSALPATIDVPVACLGSDHQVDVVLDAVDPDPMHHGALLGTSGARLDLAGGTATFTPRWGSSTTPGTTFTLGPDLGVTGCTLFADGLPFYRPYCWAIPGLVAESLEVTASIGGATLPPGQPSLRRRVAHVPAAMTLARADFSSGTAADSTIGGAPYALQVAPSQGIAADATVAWVYVAGPPTWYAWMIVVGPEVATIAFPQLDADLAAIVPAPQDAARVTGTVDYVDETGVDGFARFQDAGVGVRAFPLADGEDERRIEYYVRARP